MKNKKIIVMSTLLMSIIILGIGTVAYFRRAVNGNITGQAGNLALIVNDVSSVQNQSFNVVLKRSEDENFVMPDDSGVFNINIDLTGSSSDVDLSFNIVNTNLPDNLKFYLDENHTNEIKSPVWIVSKSESMTLTVPVYWYWNGSVDDANDILFINKELSANISVIARAHVPFETVVSTKMGNAILDYDVNFTEGASSINGEGLMVMNGTQNDKYPIVYYRGDVVNNNVIYGGFCWLIVRTTETGGTKLIYNGEVNQDGSCTNYSGVGGVSANSDYLGVYINRALSTFNSNLDSPVYVGYMYNDTNKFFTHSEGWTSGADNTGVLDASGYIAHLSDNTIDAETGHHTQNKTDSRVKSVIDTWYSNNIDGKTAESLIEDTVWCNDRSVMDNTYSIENYATTKEFYYSALTRLDVNNPATPTLTCNRNIDKFTVNKTNGNGDLDHPIGLLTADEILMAGNTLYNGDIITTYLSDGKSYWTMSPLEFYNGYSRNAFVYEGAWIVAAVNRNDVGIRPSISLNKNAILAQGNGSFEKPFLVS